MSLHIGIDQIERKLSEREKILDGLLGDNRMIVRSCSNAIKAMHAQDLKEARKYLDEATKGVEKVMPYEKEFPDQLNHILQEYSEARIVLSAIELKKIPSIGELKVSEVPYLNGLLDAMGELKREMYESLRRGDKHEAQEYFKMMEEDLRRAPAAALLERDPPRVQEEAGRCKAPDRAGTWRAPALKEGFSILPS